MEMSEPRNEWGRMERSKSAIANKLQFHIIPRKLLSSTTTLCYIIDLFHLAVLKNDEVRKWWKINDDLQAEHENEQNCNHNFCFRCCLRGHMNVFHDHKIMCVSQRNIFIDICSTYYSFIADIQVIPNFFSIHNKNNNARKDVNDEWKFLFITNNKKHHVKGDRG